MGDPCCGGSHPPEAFRCHRTGQCCTHLKGHWESPRGAFAALPGTGLYRLPTPGGLRMFSWEAAPFRMARLEPMLVLADAERQRLVACAYEMPAVRCPRYDDTAGCTIYDERPLVCQAFPLLVEQRGEALDVVVSQVCPSIVPIIAAAGATKTPERALFTLYPHEAAAALAVPAMMGKLVEIVEYLASAKIIQPLPHLRESMVNAWRQRKVLDLADVVEEAGVMTRAELSERQRDVVATIEERWRSGVTGA